MSKPSPEKGISPRSEKSSKKMVSLSTLSSSFLYRLELSFYGNDFQLLIGSLNMHSQPALWWRDCLHSHPTETQQDYVLTKLTVLCLSLDAFRNPPGISCGHWESETSIGGSQGNGYSCSVYVILLSWTCSSYYGSQGIRDVVPEKLGAFSG